MNNSSCIIIGNTGLTISCAELLLQKKYNLLAIISNDIKVKKWAINNLIHYYESIEDMLWDIDFDYLFSIANPLIIPKWLIAKPKKFAINYHDSILPKYEGTNAPSWALLNGELYHGISWHIVDIKVDAGDILEQPIFKIGDSETTFSLNLKCFEVALTSFDKLLGALESSVLEKSVQDITQRTFYYKYKKPLYGGIIDWSKNAEEIDRIFRALNFGNNLNNFCTAKLLINSKLYIVTSHKYKKSISKIKRHPGRVLSISDNSFEVIVQDGSIVIDGLIDPDNTNKILIDIIEECNIRDGTQLNMISKKDLLEYQNKLEAISKKYPSVPVDEFSIFKDFQLQNKIKHEIDTFGSSNLLDINEKDKRKIIQWNLTDNSDFKAITIHKLFENTVDEVSESIAVSYEDNYITYKELNSRANGIATYLLSLEDKCNTQKTIGILMNRSIEMIISIVAILKAGMAYVPVDTHYPYERIKHILQDSNVKFVITTTEFNKLVSDYTNPIFIDQINILNQDQNLGLYNIKDLIYILYTSGSTGLPKGADLIQLGVSNLLTWYKTEFSISQNDKILIFTAFGFDLTQKNILGALISGATVNLFSQKMFYAKEVVKYINTHKISFINCPPSAFYSLIDESSKEDIRSLRIILLGGESIKIEQIKRFREKNDSCILVNTYGPTECSDLSLTHILKDSEISHSTNIPLGRNVRNVSILILDSNLNMVPVGEIGEIYIGGISLARGYRNRPEITSRIFIANPFTEMDEFPNALGPGSRIYKTGDLGKYLEDGKIEFLGRIDYQVKIRGFRIELNEIEFIIAKVNGVKQSTVIVFEEDGIDRKKIVVYAVVEKARNDIVKLIREVCIKNLPDYMQPNQIILLDKIPLTPNGKINRSALPKPNGREGMGEYKKPKSGAEESLAKILSRLLAIEEISSTDNFFRLGGDSIIAIKVVGLMKEEGYRIKISDLYNFKTVEEISKNLSLGRSDDNDSYKNFSLIDQNKFTGILYNKINDIYPISFLQKGMLIESLKDNQTYHDVFSYCIKHKFELNKFFNVWDFLVKKHSILRTSFIEDKDYIYLALEHQNIPLDSKIIIQNNHTNIAELIAAESHIPFIFSNPGLFRLIVANKDQDSFDLIISFHHCLLDGWSLASLVKEFANLYIYGKQEPLGSLLPAYAEFVKEEIKNSKTEFYINAWKAILNNFENKSYISKFTDDMTLTIPYSLSFNFQDVQSLGIIKHAEKKGIPIDTIFLSAFVYALSRVGNYNDILLGLIVNNRPEKLNSEKHLGLYLNTIPFRYILNRKLELIDIDYLISDINSTKAKILEIKKYPYLKLKQDLQISGHFYDFCFNYVHFHVLSEELQNGDIETGLFHEKTDLPCTLDVWRKLNNFSIALNVNSQNYSKTEIQKVLIYLKYFLEMVIEEKKYISTTTIEDIQDISIWNDTGKEYGREKLVIELFEGQVKRNPDSIAVVYEDKELTYKEVNERANQLGHYLKDRYKIKADDLIGLCLDRSENMIIAILAIMKAGGAYVPMDPGYPDDRIGYILKDTGSRLVIVDEIYEERLDRIVKEGVGKKVEEGKSVQTEVLAIDGEIVSVKLQEQSKANLDREAGRENLAYVIYTSGTTGNSKGVMIESGGLINRIKWMNDKYPICSLDRIMQKTPYIFDVSVWELLWGVCYGASIVFIKAGGHRDGEYLIDFIYRRKITIMHFVPSMFGMWLDMVEEKGEFGCDVGSIKYLFCSGEALGVSLVNRCKEVLPDIEIHNLYGPTEASIDVLSYECNEKGLERVLIGKPIDNMVVYILDKNLSLVPVGGIGELYIGGVGVARGYVGRGDLTAEKFIANPFRVELEIAEGRNGRLYRSGDLVRYVGDGNIEYIGRNDFQVKMRGYRIELGEIENQMLGFEGVKQAVVIAREGNDSKYLVGYYVSESKLEEEEILRYLESKLPDYMVPRILVYLESLPLTMNGKLDRKALPDVEFRNEDNYVAPRNEVERQVCEIWSEVLKIDVQKIGINDNFFKLGGNSIKIIKLINLLKNRINLSINIIEFYSNDNVKSLAKFIESKKVFYINDKYINEGEIL